MNESGAAGALEEETRPMETHQGRAQPFAVEELVRYHQAQPPADQQEALRRRRLMRRARSKKKRGQLLAELEQRYRAGP
jgi:hypothetical protein